MNIPTRKTPAQFIRKYWILLLGKEYCNACGQLLTLIRGKYPSAPKRKVCACCATEKLERIECVKSSRPMKSSHL